MDKIYKKVLLTIVISFAILLGINTKAYAVPYLEAQGVVLMDGITGDILYSHNPHVQYEPASTTKIMTAIVILENCDLDELVTVGPNPPLSDGSGIYIEEGEVYTVEELLHALLLESANDCAEALAEHLSGSLSAFGELMTAKAEEIGALNTSFKNPSGLHEPGHLTTAYDLALIMRYALANPDFVKISRTLDYIIYSNPNSDGSLREIFNRNNCLVPWSQWQYENLYSGKTGWTPEANHTYAASAIKDDQVLISSYLNAYDKDAQYTSVGNLFEWGFENYKTIKLIEKGEQVGEYYISENITIPLLADRDIYYNNYIDKINSLDKEVIYEETDISNINIEKGQALFDAKVSVDGDIYGEFKIVSGIDRKFDTLVFIQERIALNWKPYAIIGTVILLILYIVNKRLKRNKR